MSKKEKEEVIKIFDNPQIKFSPSLPKAFTEKGLYMLATILKSPIATQTTLAIINTFAEVRELKSTLLEMHDSDSYEFTKKGLLGDAISSIVKVKEQSDLFSFFEGDPNALFGNTVKGLDDFELICFLVIK